MRSRINRIKFITGESIMKALSYLKNKGRFLIAFVVCCFIFTACAPLNDCHYEVYQNGIKIDEVTSKEIQCRSERASAFSDVYYKNIKK